MWSNEPEAVKTTSLKNEKRLSKEMGFKLTPGSGNQAWPSKKGDGNSLDLMYECKETIKDRFNITPDVLAKLCREAATIGKDPVLVVSMYGMPEPIPKEWAMVPIDVFNQMTQGERL
jgi:Holliday junction resolvase